MQEAIIEREPAQSPRRKRGFRTSIWKFMQRLDGTLLSSPTDLVGHLACEHLTQLELRAARGEIARPERVDPELDVLTRRGDEHERLYLERLRNEGQRIVEIDLDRSGPTPSRATRPLSVAPDPAPAAERTLQAMRAGTDVIYQAVLFDGRWLGRADFLRRVERPSALGPFSYEALDTKLARRVKASALLQLCSYSDLLTIAQGAEPEEVHVVLGGMDERSFRLREIAAYYRTVKRLFERATSGPPLGTYPNPVEHCEVCRWLEVCDARRRADDHLSLVANMRRDQTRKLVRAGIPTVGALAASPPGNTVKGIGKLTLERLRHQARLQTTPRAPGEIVWEFLPPEAGHGLCALPAPSPGDLFFDIEGDPFVEGGLEYLFGVIELEGGDGAPHFRAFWAHDPAQEKRAFEAVVDLFSERLARNPELHVYHYAGYEETVLKRLSGGHATRQRELDRLLRGGVFVDLYDVVRKGVRISEESYSLKTLEPLFMVERTARVKTAGGSIVQYEEWLRANAPHVLEEIERYNEEDCVSLWKLRGWLEARRRELEKQVGGKLDRPAPRSLEAGEKQVEAEDRTDELAAALTSAAASAATAVAASHLDPVPDALQLLAWLLGWHRREDRSDWWRYFGQCKKSDEDLVADTEAIGMLEFFGDVGRLDPPKRSTLYRYSFEPQENKIFEGDDVHDPRTEGGAGKVHRIDNAAGVLELARGAGGKRRHPRDLRAVIPASPPGTTEHREALARIARWVLENGIEGPGPYRAVRDLLLRRSPRVRGLSTSEPLAGEGEDPQEAAVRLVSLLEDTCLPIQGPPGSGKTRTGARMVLELVRTGKRVAITGPSHKAIGKLLEEVHRWSEESDQPEKSGQPVRLMQKAEEDQRCGVPGVRCVKDNPEVVDALDAGEVDVVAGTSWLFVRPEMEARFDTLFVDEAGQVSLANVVAMGGTARNVVLLGDPQQLAQPSKGSHPPGSEVSGLEHVLRRTEQMSSLTNGGGAPIPATPLRAPTPATPLRTPTPATPLRGPTPQTPLRATMPPEAGLFLDRSWRMHPGVCAFVSEAFYEGRLQPAPGCEAQRLAPRAATRGQRAPNLSRDMTGLRYVPVEHHGNRSSSPEEVNRVREILEALLGPGEAGGSISGGSIASAERGSSVGSHAPAEWTGRDGRTSALALEDVLVVAPYNVHVAALASRLPGGARVGTVDKFQGQEAPVVIYSMASSSAEDLPRDMEFLYSLNRLNVAVSRAHGLAILVCSPRLLQVRCRTPEQMRLANALCRFVEMARNADSQP